jgi:hypothetical protein
MGILYPVSLSKEQSTMAEEITEEIIKHIQSL